MKKLLLTIFFISAGYFSHAQTADSLKGARLFYRLESIRRLPPGIEKVQQSIELSATIIETSNVLNNLLDEGLDVALKAKRTDLLAALYVQKSRRALLENQPLNAKAFSQKAAQYFEGLSVDSVTALQKSLAANYLNFKHPQKGLEYYKQVDLSLQQAPGKLEERLANLKDMSKAYRALNKTKEFKSTLKESVSLAKESGNKKMITAAEIDWADGLINTGEAAEGTGLYKKLLIDFDLSDKERVHVLSRLIINLIKLNSDEDISGFYRQLQDQVNSGKNINDKEEYWLATAMYYEYRKQSLQAKSVYLQLLHQQGTPSEAHLEGMVHLADLYSRELKKDSADHYFRLAATQLKLLPALHAITYVYEKSFAAHEQRFQKNALLVTSLTNALTSQDSQYRQELLSVTRELSMKNRVLESERKVEQMMHQQQVNDLNHVRMQQRAWLVIAVLCFIAILAMAGTYIFYSKKKQAALLYKKELETVKHQHRAEIILGLSKAQESERGRMADQLHDEIGSMLSVARLNLSSLKNGHFVSHEQSGSKIETAEKILGEVAQTVREMSHQLMPVALKKYGFKKAVAQLMEDITLSGKLSLEHVLMGLDELDKYPEELKVGLYRIIQELLQNIIKHSGADKAFLQLIEHEDVLSLMIEDNGTGMQVNKENNGKGLQLVSSRIQYFEGRITVEKGSEGGTLIVIEIPLRHFVQV